MVKLFFSGLWTTPVDQAHGPPSTYKEVQFSSLPEFPQIKNSPKTFTCLSGKLRVKSTSPTAKSTSAGLLDTNFFVPCTLYINPVYRPPRGQPESEIARLIGTTCLQLVEHFNMKVLRLLHLWCFIATVYPSKAIFDNGTVF